MPQLVLPSPHPPPSPPSSLLLQDLRPTQSIAIATPRLQPGAHNHYDQYRHRRAMSSSAADARAATATSPPSSYFFQSPAGLGLGYIVAISLGFLALLSTLLLAFFVCFRHTRRHRRQEPSAAAARLENGGGGGGGGVVLPRIIFVAEGEEDEGAGERSPVPGLDQAAINSYPKFPFSRSKSGDAVCSICLCEYREGEMLRMMPDCRHYFHLTCVDAWLRLNASCPVCRTSPMPTPLSTPLSELVPLSHYSADRRRR